MNAIVYQLAVRLAKWAIVMLYETFVGKSRSVDKRSKPNTVTVLFAIIVVIAGTSSYFFKEAVYHKNRTFRLEAIIREHETSSTSALDCPMTQEEIISMVEEWDGQREYLMSSLKQAREDHLMCVTNRTTRPPPSIQPDPPKPPRRNQSPSSSGSNTQRLLEGLQRDW